jgi:hypothetical protein
MEAKTQMSNEIKSPLAIYDPQGNLAYLGLHSSHIAAWMGFFGGTIPYGSIVEKANAGWDVKRVAVEPISNVVGLRQHGQVKRDTMPVETSPGEFSKEIV